MDCTTSTSGSPQRAAEVLPSDNGNRGYRLAQLEAALYAGRLHLAAEALGLGAVGSTSFDDEVIDVFSPVPLTPATCSSPSLADAAVARRLDERRQCYLPGPGCRVGRDPACLTCDGPASWPR